MDAMGELLLAFAQQSDGWPWAIAVITIAVSIRKPVLKLLGEVNLFKVAGVEVQRSPAAFPAANPGLSRGAVLEASANASATVAANLTASPSTAVIESSTDDATDSAPLAFPRLSAVERLRAALNLSYAVLPANQQNVSFLLHQLAYDRVERDFLTVYATIFGSQAKLLLAAEETDEGLKVETARDLYAEVGAAFDKYPFTEWLRWLVTNGLVEIDRRGISLSQRGREFLEWTRVTNRPTAVLSN